MLQPELALFVHDYNLLVWISNLLCLTLHVHTVPSLSFCIFEDASWELAVSRKVTNCVQTFGGEGALVFWNAIVVVPPSRIKAFSDADFPDVGAMVGVQATSWILNLCSGYPGKGFFHQFPPPPWGLYTEVAAL